MTNRCELYRHFDGDGNLLYVGISLSTFHRLSQHKDHSRWFSQIRRVEIETHSSRDAALAAERHAILSEKPKYNLMGRENLKEIERAEREFVQASRRDLTRRMVQFKPIYKLQDVAELLTISKAAVIRLMQKGQLGFIELPGQRENYKPVRVVTGWQLIDYIESTMEAA